ncbi:MAG: hypothetical protein M1839_008181 [Geoglossum umbratile]|nr:MAG: hypothetical protein M1839_008181 [Geoglossum umbratile]
MASVGPTYNTYINGAPANSNQPEAPQEGRYGREGYAYLNTLLQPSLNPHAGVLPNTSRSYMQNTFLGGTNVHNVHMDLSILDSETHSDGRVIEEIRSSSGAGARRNATGMVTKRDAVVDVDSGVGSSKQSDGRSRKKPRANSHGSDGEGTGKKARGRPRVDTRDETAADRRRTQIRLAQRAYRLRKETTISSLKERVTELQSAIEGMNKSFLRFGDNAMSSGIMQERPDLVRDLREATEQFLMLARIANLDQENDFDEETEEGDGQDQENVVEDKPKTSSRRGTAKQSGQMPPAPEGPKPDPWGYRVVQGEQPLNRNGKRPSEPSSPEFQHDAPRRGWESASASRSPIPTTSEGTFGPVQTLQQYHAEIPSPDRYHDAFVSQQIAPPIPWTFSSQETTFARYLHRAAIERGYYLLLSPDSPPDEINRVFQFCFTWSDRNETLQRLRGMLSASTKECLEFWQAPLTHIGGAGLRYPRKDALGNTKGLTGVTSPVRPVGPMALANTVYAREKGLTPESILGFVGLEGEWFDCYDVESYLREKGVVLAGDSSFIEVEIGSQDPFDVVSVEPPPSPGLSGGSSGSSNANSYSSPSEHSMSFNNNDGFNFPDDILFPDVVTANQFTTGLTPGNDSYFAPDVEKPLRGDDNIHPPKGYGHGLDSFGFITGMQPNVTSIPHILNNNAAALKELSGRKRLVRIDIPTLVEGMTF